MSFARRPFASSLFAACLLLYGGIAGRGADLSIATGRIYTELVAHPSEMDDIRNVGARMIRVAFEDHGDASQIGVYRTVVAMAKARGIGVAGLLDPNSAPYGNPTTQAYRDAFTNSAIWHIKTFPDVKHWEIWNEPENFGFQSDPSRYAPLLIQTYERIAAARSSGEIPADVQVVCAGVVDTGMAAIVFDAPEMRAYRAAHNGAVPFDIANYHPYSGGDPWDAAPKKPNGFREGLNFTSWFSKVAAMKGTDGLPLFGDRPFWFTEFGFSTSGFGTTGARTALLHIAEDMRALPRIENAFWYDYHDDAELYGLRYAGTSGSVAGGPKPVYYAFAAEALGVGIRRGASGTTPTVVDAFVTKFIALGGRAVVGSPAVAGASAEAQRVGTGWVQRFAGGSAGPGAITLSDSDAVTPHWMAQPFLAAWDYRGGAAGPLGYPISERRIDSGRDRQNTAYGFLLMDDGGAVAGLFGDADGDWTLTSRDAATALGYGAGTRSLASPASVAADAFPLGPGGAVGDGTVDVRDAVHILSTLR